MFSTATFFNPSPEKNARPPLRFKQRSGLELSSVLSEVKPGDVCIYWYVGTHGLKQGAIDFYKDALTQNIKVGAMPVLVDLSAWSAFSGAANQTRALARYHESAISLEGEQLGALRCCDYFARLRNIKCEDPVFPLLAEITLRESLRLASDSFKASGMTIGTLFNRECPAIEAIYELDSAKSYSVLQYIEILFLIEMALEKRNGMVKTIKFILPNDESKYYNDALIEDLTRFLKARNRQVDNLTIEVNCFIFGNDISHRPYNIPSKTLPAKKQLTLSDVVNSDELKQTYKLGN